MFSKLHKMAILSGLILGLLLVAQTSGLAYGVWNPAEEFDALGDLDNLIESLSTMHTRAVAGNSAHPEFLADLERFLLEFQNYRQKLAKDYGTGTVSGPVQTDQLSFEVKYLGRTADKVGEWEQTTPNGKNDEHIQIRAYFPENTLVENIRIWTANSDGTATSTWWWSDSTGSSSPRRAWVLGVYQDNKMLNPNREESLGWFRGWSLFDLYAAVQGDDFAVGKYLLVQINTSDGGEYKQVFRSQGAERPFE